MITLTAIDHINITASDLDASIEFYGRLFGFEIAEDCRDDQRPYVIMGKPGVGWLALHSQTNGGPSEGGRINHWGFVVEDFDGLRAGLIRSARTSSIPTAGRTGSSNIRVHVRSTSPTRMATRSS